MATNSEIVHEGHDMAKKDKKGFSTLTIKELLIKITIIPLHSLKWLKLKWLAAKSVGKCETTGTRLWQMEIWNDTNTLENSLRILKQLKYTGIIQPSRSTPIFNPRVTKTCVYTDLYMIVDSFIRNSLKLKTTHMSLIVNKYPKCGLSINDYCNVIQQ